MVKYINSFLFALCVLLSFSACEREEDITVSVLEYVNENIITTYYGAFAIKQGSCTKSGKEKMYIFSKNNR